MQRFHPEQAALTKQPGQDALPAFFAPLQLAPHQEKWFSMDTSLSTPEETLDTSSPPDRQGMVIVEGSRPQLSVETNDLLRTRLRSASLLMFAGFLAFFIRSLFRLDQLQTSLDRMLFVDHALMTLVTGLVGLRLCTNCALILRHLRTAELVVFGGSAIFFLFYGYALLTGYAAKGYLVPVTPAWLILIFTYALFVPNYVRRAAAIITMMALAPVLLLLVVYTTSEAFASVVRSNPDFSGYVTESVLIMALSAGSAIWGVATIGNLRRQVFEAKQLGQYRLTTRIGDGGMGEVYLAEHLLLKRPCAIKLIRPDKAGDARVLARFEREVKATAKLSHLNTIEIYDYGRAEDGTFYYVMEYLPGLSLAELVELDGPQTAGRVIHLLAQACDALREAHDKQLVHRDIKPANIFAAHRGGVFDVAKLLDFGLVRPLTDVSQNNLTADGGITGSPTYISPEQVTGDQPVDARTDIYSLGTVAYHLLAGVPPFQHDRPMKVMLAHARDQVLPPSEHMPSIPEDLEQVVLRCLEKDPDDRYQDARSLRTALLDCTAAGSWTDEMATDWWHGNGCPKKRALDEAVLAASSLPDVEPAGLA